MLWKNTSLLDKPPQTKTTMMWKVGLLSLLVLLTTCHGQTLLSQTCSADRRMTAINPNANVVIGGLFDLRGMGQNGIGCGRPLEETMQIFEGSRYMLDVLNNFNSGAGYISGVTIGMQAYDACFSSANAMNILQKLYPQTTANNVFCAQNSQVIPGVIGPLASGTSLHVAKLAREIPVSLISPWAETAELSNNFKYPTFLRTTPSSAVFAKAVVELLKGLQWENVMVIYADDSFGRNGYQEMLKSAFNNGICVSQSLAVPPNADKDGFKTVLNAIGSSPPAAAVLITANYQTKTILEAVNEIASLNSVQWILSDLSVHNDINRPLRLRGALVVEPSSPMVASFRQYFTQLMANPQNNVDNPWFEDWFEEVFSCSFSGNTCPTPTQATLNSQFVQSPYAVSAMKAVLAYAEIVRSICAGVGGGVCPALQSMSASEFHNRLMAIDFTIPNTFPVDELRGQRIRFDTNGDFIMSDFTIYNYNQRQGQDRLEEIGRVNSTGLTLDRQPTLYDPARATILTSNPTALCSDVGCQDCLLPQRSITHRYTPGDIVIASLVNAHDFGSAPFTCGRGDPSRLAALVAAEWAVQQFKTNNPNKLRQVSLGSLVADICPDQVIAQGFLTDLLSGNNRLMDQTGDVIPYRNIYAFVDQTDSYQAQVISPILSKYMIPELESTATSPDLVNNAMNSYFTRAIPNEDVYFTAIASLLQRLGWKYVQVATHANMYFNDMLKTFMRVAAKYDICVVGTALQFSDSNGDRYNQALDQLLDNDDSNIVIVLGDMNDVRGLLTAIAQRNVIGRLQLIAGNDRWARNPDYTRGVEAAALGAIVLDLELAENVEFRNYLARQNLADISVHPFMRELFEMTNMCSLTPSNSGLYSRVCTSSDNFNNVYQGKTPYIIRSVYAVADQLHSVIVDVCKNNQYTGLCANFQAATDIGMRLDMRLQNLAKVNGFGISNGEGISNIVFYVYRQGGFTQMGQFNTETMNLGNQNLNQLNNSQGRVSQCGGACLQCQYMAALQSGHFNMGDWLIGGVFGVSDPGPMERQPYVCGDIRLANGPQFTTAMMYAIEQVNSGRAPVSVNGVKFGGLALDHCSNPGRANLVVSDVYAGILTNMGLDPNRILAWLTDITPSTREAAELLDPLGVAMVSPGATSAGLLQYPNFYRTIQGDTVSATILAKIIKTLGFEYFQVAYSASSFGRDALETMNAVAQSEGICITNSVEFSNSKSASEMVSELTGAQTKIVVLYMSNQDVESMLQAIVNNPTARTSLLVLMSEPFTQVVSNLGQSLTYPILSIQVQKSVLTNYTAYLNSGPTNNPHFAKYYMNVKQCNLPGYSIYPSACQTPLPPITQDVGYTEENFVLPTINAVYAVVDALDRTVRYYCGANYAKPCAEFHAAQDKRERFNNFLNSVTFVDEGRRTFRFLNREGKAAYDIVQSTGARSNPYRKIGTYAGVSLQLDASNLNGYTRVESACRAPCLGCIMNGLTFSHIRGDIYLAGVFDVHSSSVSPFTCGDIQTLHGYLLLEAFNYAINQVNSKQGQFANILRGTTLGGVGLDACGSRIRGGYLVSNIHNGLSTLAKDGVLVTPSQIDAYIGSYESPASLYLARILTDLQIPQISYNSGAGELSDTRVYPWFYRTVPSDETQVEAMLKFLNETNIRYVQILYEDNSNGISAKDYFIANAVRFQICVAQAVSYPDIGQAKPETSNNRVIKLIENPAANTVVTFLSTIYVNSVLKAIDVISQAKGKLRFMGSTAWADNQEAIAGAQNQARGSLTVKLDSDDVEDFERHINLKTVTNSTDNSWFDQYYQEILNCYLSKANKMGYPSQCPINGTNLINSPRYQQDPGVVYVINAVYAAAFAMDETLKMKCGNSYTTVCQNYLNDLNRRNSTLFNLANVHFTDPVGNEFKFQERSGLANYRFYLIDDGPLGGVTYKEVGVYNMTSDQVSQTAAYTSRWDSSCEREDACSECPAIRDSAVRHVFRQPTGGPDAQTIVAFFDIHKQGVDPYRCGAINEAGFQQFISFLFTMDDIIDRTARNYRVLVIDTCSNSLRVDQDLYGLLQGTGLCNIASTDDLKQISMENLAAVVTVGEENTVAAARVLEPLGITYISPNALSTMLDDKMHLVRTIAPIGAIMKTLSAFLKDQEWTFIDIMYENATSGVYSFKTFVQYADADMLCRGSNMTGATVNDIQPQLMDLSGDRGSNAVVLLGSHNFVRNVIQAARNRGMANQYVWVLAVEWDVTDDFLKSIADRELELKFIIIQRLTDMVKNFDDYINDLKYDSIHRPSGYPNIPGKWYDDYYEAVFDCTLNNTQNKGTCDTAKMFSEGDYMQNKYVLNTIAATYATIMRVDDAKVTNPLDMMDRMKIDNRILGVRWSMMNDLNLVNETEFLLELNNTGRWWEQGYTIQYIHLGSGGKLEKKDNVYSMPGAFKADKAKRLEDAFSLEKSECDEGTVCCSIGTGGQNMALVDKKSMAADHRNYYKYDSRGQAYDWPVWAIAVAVLTSLGLIITAILFLILLFVYPKRGGTSVLGYMAIVGIIAIYAINFAFFLHATDAVCGIRRFLMGVVYMIAMAPLLVKAVDNWRFNHVDFADQRYSGISSAFSLFMMAVVLVLVQCIIPIMWLILVHPEAVEWAPEGGALRHDNWWCTPVDEYDEGLVQSHIFVMFIILVTAVFAALGYDTDRNNYESRWILFCCICTAGCFLVWMIVSTNAGPPFRDPAIAIGNFVNATLLLLLLPLRKSILLCRALREKSDKDERMEVINGGASIGDMYSNGGYDNRTFELVDYDNDYINTKPSEF